MNKRPARMREWLVLEKRLKLPEWFMLESGLERREGEQSDLS